MSSTYSHRRDHAQALGSTASSLMAGSWSGAPPPLEEDDPLLGTTLSHTYAIQSILGEGGMGRVYEANHTRISQKRFAIKVLHPEFAREPEVLGRFQREAEAAACVSHPNVVGVYDVDRTPQGWPYLVCEYLDGVDFSEQLKQHGALETEAALHIAKQICDALAAAHDANVIHRDLKPQNVFLLGDFIDGTHPNKPNVKVLDFGLSRFLDASDAQLTRTGVIMGTPSYMAPEQAHGERVDHRADVYGIGAILYASVTGKPPFNEETPQMTVLAVMNDDPKRPRSLNSNVSQELELVIQRAMAKKPNERFQTMTELKLALESLSTEAGNARTPPESGTQARGRLASVHGAEVGEVATARPRLLLFMLLGLVTSLLAIATALTGAIHLSTNTWPLSRMELILGFLVIAGTLLTPGLLLFKKLRRNVWSNSHRVLEVLRKLRSPIVAALLAYGLSALAIRFFDQVVHHLVPTKLFGYGSGVAWSGWNIILSVIALIAGGTALLRGQIIGNNGGRTRHFVAGPLLLPSAVILMLFGFYSGFVWRAGQKLPLAATATTLLGTATNSTQSTPSAEVTQPEARRRPPTEATSAAKMPEPDPAVPTRSVDDNLLAGAISQGVDGLLPLSEEHPNDPRVLRALAMAFASKASGHADSMAMVKRLLILEPGQMHDTDLRYLITRSARTPGEAGKLAFQIMREHMGSLGADILYDISLRQSKLRARALKELAKPSLRKKFSPALSIAYDLRFAASCAARVPLLERAAQHGDQRSIMVLSPLSARTKRGCGKWKRDPCRPKCRSQAAQFRDTIRAINKLAQTK